jgi:hypothetical protein
VVPRQPSGDACPDRPVTDVWDHRLNDYLGKVLAQIAECVDPTGCEFARKYVWPMAPVEWPCSQLVVHPSEERYSVDACRLRGEISFVVTVQTCCIPRYVPPDPPSVEALSTAARSHMGIVATVTDCIGRHFDFCSVDDGYSALSVGYTRMASDIGCFSTSISVGPVSWQISDCYPDGTPEGC